MRRTPRESFMNETEHIACQQKKDEELLKIPRPFS